ncbi:class III heat-shock ATP-dependent LonA protease [Spiroplasma sabaudiense Ar-1343]|uniref:Lon protease n=1 Tax=Spiroplasma sabaudiense Ar-1343 TaxID=1276257 RepID=W6A9N7_9MOLU|nr:endopeptidase La [Spiroplasma sabaudiense]AHI53717.1 class III heat-shock ATP-dependent LonA protease [Spiroplasma sabaudiense Ar-1343]
MSKIKKLPLLVTRGSYIFPTFEQSLEIGRDKSTLAVKSAISEQDSKILLVSQKKPLDDNPKIEDIFNFGVLADISIKKEWKDGTSTVNIKALERVNIKNIELNEFYIAEYEVINLETFTDDLIKNKVIKHLKKMIESQDELPSDISDAVVGKKDANLIVDTVAHFLPFIPVEKKQQLLEELDPVKRLNIINDFLDDKKKSADIETNISKKIKSRIDEQQREYYLREKLKAIKEELGDMDDEGDDIKKYRNRLENEPFPESVKERVLQELDRYESMPASSSEANIIRSYIDWVMQIPWWEKSEEKQDLAFAREILDKYHFGLKKVKDRIIEYLAVKQKTNSVKGQIITLVGPPGVGKTSLAKSIAESMGRNFVKVSLGGVKDEAEIRGHRKTYIGSMPGRIIQAMKKAKTKNPVFLLDEIDKMSSDYKGDPSSAMLEVLDPEQNENFSDHYIEESYDLSDVVFIATANYPENIPEALYDRMEIIELSSYTEIEKLQIAQNYLISKVLDNHAVTKTELEFTSEAISEIIKHYTREAGVRQLERSIASITRKFVVKLLNKELKSLKVTPKVVNELLGKRIFDFTSKEKTSQIGVVTGLAYTQFGGDILPIEVNHFPGKGGLVLTGKLGDVMKESATIALDYVKSNYDSFGIPKEVFENNDIHIHVPEGAVPKDGPSAGVTLTTAIISALTNRPVSKEIGMTGEITLRGLVFPIGGLREKSISAHRSGLKKILVPIKNLKDLEDIPDEVKAELEIIGTEKYEDVFEHVFSEKPKKITHNLPITSKPDDAKKTNSKVN